MRLDPPVLLHRDPPPVSLAPSNPPVDRLSLFHFTGARFPEISSTYYTHHYTPPPPPPPTSTSLSLARSRPLYLRLALSPGYSPRYANLPLHHVSLACSHEAAAAGGGGGGGSARCGPHGRPRARIQAVSGGQVDTSGGDAALSVGVVGGSQQHSADLKTYSLFLFSFLLFFFFQKIQNPFAS